MSEEWRIPPAKEEKLPTSVIKADPGYFIAEPIYKDNDLEIEELSLEPIIAWIVEASRQGQFDGWNVDVMPVSIENMFRYSCYAVKRPDGVFMMLGGNGEGDEATIIRLLEECRAVQKGKA